MTMKNSIIAFILLFFFVNLGYGQAVEPASFDSPFSVYAGDVSWEKEMFFLHNFSIYLDEHPDMVGHIVYFSSKKVSRQKLEKRMRRSVKYLTQNQKIDRERLVVYYGGTNEESKIVLQPLKKTTSTTKQKTSR